MKFALYTDNECFFNGAYIKKTNAFLANTSILYNGEWIAIWNVQEEMNPIVLTSKIIHEMFHGFQMMQNESRFCDDLDALYNYKYEEDNLNLKVKENKLLFLTYLLYHNIFNNASIIFNKCNFFDICTIFVSVAQF